MKIFNECNSMMILGLANTLANQGTLKEEDRKAIFNLGYFMEELATIREAKGLVKEIEDILNKRRGNG